MSDSMLCIINAPSPRSSKVTFPSRDKLPIVMKLSSKITLASRFEGRLLSTSSLEAGIVPFQIRVSFQKQPFSQYSSVGGLNLITAAVANTTVRDNKRKPFIAGTKQVLVDGILLL